MNIPILCAKLKRIYKDFADGTCDEISTEDELESYGFTEKHRDVILTAWKEEFVAAEGERTARDINADLYKRIEMMARANPILQTLKAISVKLERLTNQADRLDALLIPFAGPYPDLPTLLFLEDLCSAIDDLPLAFVNYFSIELDMLRVHSKTTQVWLEALECEEPHTDFDAGATLRYELHRGDIARLTDPDPTRWICKNCKEDNARGNWCRHCGVSRTWGTDVNGDEDKQQPF